MASRRAFHSARYALRVFWFVLTLAPPCQAFRYVTLPALCPGFVVGGLFARSVKHWRVE